MQMRTGPAGIHLFHRATGLNVLIDDVKVSSSLWSAAPRAVSVALTNACDLHCAYCYAPKTPACLDADLLIAWIDELNADGCLGVGFGGGEPTLCRDLPRLCAYLKRNTEMAVTFTTHGHHLNDTLAGALEGNVHFVRLSMDGVGATYEILRGRSFSHFLGSVGTAARLAPFGINFVVNSMTFPCLDQAIDISARMGATEFLLLPERPSGGRPGIDRRTLEALTGWVASYKGEVPLTISETDGEGLPTCNPLDGECGLRGYVHVDALGHVKRSSYDRRGISIGSTGIMAAIESLEELGNEE